MKFIHSAALCCIVIILSACAQTSIPSASVIMNQEIKDYRGNTILLGKSTRERLEQSPYNDWFTKNYTDYTVDTATALQIRSLVKNKRFVLFMGTWCGDSRREVPKIYKLLDFCGISRAQVQLINLNNQGPDYKQSPTHEEKGLNIIRVPTLLVMAHNKETGRIVETPVASWEKDLLAILTGKDYVPRYHTALNKN